MTELLTRYNKFCVFICTVLATTLRLEAQTGSGSGSETTLSSNGTAVQWAHTKGDSVSGVIYDLAQPIKVTAPTGYTVVLKNVSENEEYDTQLTVVNDVHAVLQATGNLDGKGYGGIFYKSDNNTDWDHWTTTYVAYAKPQSTNTEDQDSGEIITQQGLPVYTLSQTQIDTLVGANAANAGTYAVEIWTDSSGTENKKLVSAQQINEDWFRKENSNGDIEQYDLVPSYDSFDEVKTFLVTEGFMEPLTEQGTAEVTFVFVDGQPTGFIIDEEEDAEGSETTLSSNGTAVQWAHTKGDSVSGVIYDLAQPIKVTAPTGYTVVLKNVAENEEYDTQLTVVNDVHAVLQATGNLDGKGYGGIFYKSDNNTDWDHWTTTYVAYAKPQSTNTEDQDSGEIITQQGLPVYTLSQTQIDTLVGANAANAGTYAVEIWTDSSGTENKKLVSAQQINEDWFRKENSNGDIEQYDLVPSYDSFDEVKTFLVTEGFMEPLTEQGTAEVTFVFVDGQPTGFIIDEEEDAEGSETTLSSNGTAVQWAHTKGDSVSGVIYDLAQPIKVTAPTGYTVVLKNVAENEEYDTQLTVVNDVHAVLQATGNLDGKGYGGIFYKSDNNTDWDHWTTTYVAYAKPQSTNTEDQDSGEIITQQGLPVYTLSQTQIDTLVGANAANAGTYAVEIWTDSSGTENKKLVSAQQINEDWFRKENSNGDIEQYDLVPSYDSFDEVKTFLVTEGFMEPLTEQGTAEVTFVFVDGQPTGFIIDEEEDAEGSETTLSSNGTAVQWAHTKGDSVSGVIYDLAQPIKVTAPTGYTVVLKNVAENEEYDTQLTVVNDVHAVLQATGNLDGKGYGGIFYKSDNNTDWDHWTTTYVAYAKPQSTNTEDQDSGEIITQQGLPVYTLSQTQIDTLVGANAANAGTYAVEIWTDSSGTENKKLVSAQQINEDWFRKENSNGDIEQYDLVPSYDSFDEVKTFLVTEGFMEPLTEQGTAEVTFVFVDGQPTGFIIDEEEEHHGPFNFTIIDEIDLKNQQELIDLSPGHDDVWFQRVNLEDGRYIWALSVENGDEKGSTSESSNLMVEMNGSVYEGDFHDYWRDAFDIMVDNNSTNWREDRFDANPEGIKNLLFQFPEIRGPNAPVSPIVKTDPPKSSLGNKARFVGKLITDGNNRNLSLGFQFSEDLRFNDVIEVLSRGDNFEAEYDFSKYESKYLYYRAFARNEEFESFGARKRLEIDVLATTKINGAKVMEGGWESSDWFGHYYIQENGWIYHEDLGWCFLVIQKNNHWLWMEKCGWLWTKPSVWPYLYDNENANWLYLLKRKSGPSLFFDRKKEQFLPIHN